MSYNVKQIYEIAKRYIPIGNGDSHELEHHYQEHLRKNKPETIIIEREVIREVLVRDEVVGMIFNFDTYSNLFKMMALRKYETQAEFSRASGLTKPMVSNHMSDFNTRGVSLITMDTWLETCGYELVVRKRKDSY